MGERVLCGCVRQAGKHPPSDGTLDEHLRHLESTVPFVYRSVQANAKDEDPETHSVIRDQVERHDTRWTGIHSVLKILRQPVLFVSATDPPPDPSLLEKLTDQWNRCPKRLSGVFLRSDDGFQRYPGLYAAPLLAGLRETRRKRNVTMNELIANEPTRRIKYARTD